MRDTLLVAVSNVDLSRAQFAMTTIFHFIFVPITIGLAFLVATLQTMWHRNGDENLLRATRFFGVLLLINVAIGVVTGIVQEFEFGMNWSNYSRFVGDVFGAPLAMEGLIAFFLESTFLGVWLFGWNRLPKKVHLATIWLVAFGTLFSAAFSDSTPSMVSVSVPMPSTGTPSATRQCARSVISGSRAALISCVSPLARVAAISRFSVAPTDTFGKFTSAPTRPPFGAFANM